ncbi:hypothetical protein VW23_014840 [Devosia insulae DS-56]|uniref:RNA polymerase subunit sigma n=1 Tax=Devosia insulae DS-56 TaxID=1116389 RepID=A0A1E5XT65_9HYPH|nr:DUF1109 domain-containing protein [Devosia insulae]OEO31745.1 hypothetical protein VW23_014840 [Devosia insulae DS-56]
MSDELLDRLTADLRPTPRRALQARLFGWAGLGIVLSAIIMLAWLGPRPDMMQAPGSMMFWTKFAYTAGFAIIGGIAALNLARPGGKLRRQVIGLAMLVLLVGAGGLLQLMLMGPEQMGRLVMGSTALRCPFYIVALAAPIYAAVILAMRRAAPTNPTLAGFAAGLFAGGAGVWVYAFHCTESGMPFIAIWYTAGVLATALIGAVIGRFALRW